ncbi:hypothetical protein IGI04_019095 [Brassica rapa subsp. trilocularis]|uniref:Uncharacterized protein n=1 Tax=Brassica rapa subsp. trilocularis TaxID=1813537 RepID=A0ABQ7MIA6_BRACM|nr:hypothetical protein IGI04_019095 [Brassica rapa subsp. trilocularis]
MAATKMVFHHMVFIFHSFKGRFINFRYEFLFFRTGRLPNDFQEVFHTTSRKSSDRVLSHVLIRWFSSSLDNVLCVFYINLGLIYMFFRSGSDFGRPMKSLLKYNAQKKTYTKVVRPTTYMEVVQDKQVVHEKSNF